MDIDSTLTSQIAHLARLELTDAETAMFTAQLKQVLSYVELLQQVDVEGVEPLIHPMELATAWREDAVKPSPVNSEGKPRVLSCGPEVLFDGFKVPPVL